MSSKIPSLTILLFLSALTGSAQGWSTPVLISDMPGINNNQDMCIDCSGTRHVVWSHKVLNGYWIIMYSKSTTGGTTWSTPDTIVNLPGAWLYEPHIVSDTINNLYVSFDSISQGGGYGQIFYVQNIGNGWTSPIKVSTSVSSRTNKISIDKNNRLYLFWHEFFNLNTKFVYRYMENDIWSNILIPYTDTNVYVLENVDIDKGNNIHCIGYFNYFGQSSYNMVFFYSMYDYLSNTWSEVFLLNDKRISIGCDVSCDSIALPSLVWGQYTNNTLPYEFATIFKKQDILGWADNDTITKDAEYNQKLVVDKYNTVHIIDCYVLPDNNTLTTFNYYSMSTTGWSKEILDENGSIIMFDMEASNETVDIVYGKMIDRPGTDTVRIYFISKSILVDLPQPINREQPLSIYPNPCDRWATISVTPTNLIPISMKVFNMEGKPVKTFFENQIPANKNQISWDLTDDNSRFIPSGVYLLVLQSKKFIYVKRFVKI